MLRASLAVWLLPVAVYAQEPAMEAPEPSHDDTSTSTAPEEAAADAAPLFLDTPPVPPPAQLRGPPPLDPLLGDGEPAETFLARGMGQWVASGLAWGLGVYGLGTTISFWGIGTKHTNLGPAERYPFWVNGAGPGWNQGDYQAAAAITGVITLGLMVAGSVFAWYASDNLDRYRELRMLERAEIAALRRTRWEQSHTTTTPSDEVAPATEPAP